MSNQEELKTPVNFEDLAKAKLGQIDKELSGLHEDFYKATTWKSKVEERIALLTALKQEQEQIIQVCSHNQKIAEKQSNQTQE